MSRTYYHRHFRKSYKWPPYWRNVEDRAVRAAFKSLLKTRPDDVDLLIPRRPSIKGFYD